MQQGIFWEAGPSQGHSGNQDTPFQVEAPARAPSTPSGPRDLQRAVSLEALAPSCRGGLKLSTSLYVTPGVGETDRVTGEGAWSPIRISSQCAPLRTPATGDDGWAVLWWWP